MDESRPVVWCVSVVVVGGRSQHNSQASNQQEKFC